MMIFLLLLVIAAFGGLLMAVEFGSISLDALSGWPIASAVIGALIVLYLATHYGSSGEGRFGRLLAAIAILVVIGFGVEVLRFDPPDLLANYLSSPNRDDEPNALTPKAPASVRIRRNSDGAFVANSEVNGQAMPLLIDSGAATVVLRQSDAELAGIDVKSLTFDTPLKSANGTSYLAPARLKSVRIGPLVLNDVEALVAQPGTLNESLLGMSFLRRLPSYEVTGDFVTLRQ
jgi:aspartyl protease family protein